MHGNVMEWCWDWFDDEYYENSPPTDPLGPESGSNKVYRSGSWVHDAEYCRSAFRSFMEPSYRNIVIGFRILRPEGI